MRNRQVNILTRMPAAVAAIVLAISPLALATTDSLSIHRAEIANANRQAPLPGGASPQIARAIRGIPAIGAAAVYSDGGKSYLGVDINDVTPERMSALKLKEEGGVEITMVDQDAPASKAGLKQNDVITTFNGTKVDGEEQLRRMIRETPPGRKVTLGISRDGNPMTFSVTLAARGKTFVHGGQPFFKHFTPPDTVFFSPDDMPEIPEMPDLPEMPPMPPSPKAPRAPRLLRPVPPLRPEFDIFVHSSSTRTGLVVESLTRQLGEFFGAKNGEGILVRSVEKGSPAEAAGIKAGDVIINLDKERISEPSDWKHVIRNHRAGEKINVRILRNKKEQNLSLTVPQARTERDSSALRIELPEIDETELEEAVSGIEESVRATQPTIRAMLDKNLAPTMGKVQVTIRKAQEKARRELDGSRSTLEKERRALKNLRKKLDSLEIYQYQKAEL